MRDDLVEIAMVVDASGSMGPLQDETISGFNNFLDEQRILPGDATVSLTFFNSTVSIERRSAPIKSIEPINVRTYTPNGYTALYDAVGRTIDDLGERLNAMPESERPHKVMLVIMTDGLENASQVYTRAQVAEMMRHQQEVYNWDVLFLGANMDSAEVGAEISIDRDQTIDFDFTPAGIKMAFNATSNRATMNRIANR